MNESIAKYYTHTDESPVRLNTSCLFRGHLLWFIAKAPHRLRQTIGPRAVHDDIVAAFLTNLSNRLDVFARQTILFEKKLYQALTNSKSVGYSDFVESLSVDQSRVFNLLSQYPGLEKLLSTITVNFCDNAVEFAVALNRDYDEIRTRFGLPRSLEGRSIEISLTDGELHCSSRSIVIVSIDGEKAFAYKPRNLAAEAKLTALLRDFSSDLALDSDWNLPEYIMRDSYGWVKWVGYREALDEASVRRFYQRAGYLIGFSELYGISDLHNGNIVAHGDSPVPVDMEAALTPELMTAGAEEVGTYGAWNLLGTGLLPSATWKGGDLVGVDTSGLGGLDSQYCSMSVYQNTGKGQLDEAFSDAGTTIEPALNVLRHQGEIQKPWNYLDELEAGYRVALSTIPRKPRAIVALGQLAETEMRYIHQSTAGYHFALQASAHPCLLTDLHQRHDYLLSCLSATSSENRSLLEAEVLACEGGDVPRFVGRPDSVEVREPSYLLYPTRIPEARLSGIQNSAQMVASVDQARIEFGARLLRGSMKALEIHYTNGAGFRSSLLIPPKAMSLDDAPRALAHEGGFGSAASESLMAMQRYIARQEAVSSNPQLLEWYGCKTSPSGGMEFGQVGTDLYHGSSGILVAMRLLGCYDFDGLVMRATRSAISELNRDITKLGGSYIGLASAVLPLYALGAKISDVLAAELTAAAKGKFERAVLSRHPMQYFIGSDLICGVAGALNVAAIMYAATADAQWRALADGVAAILLAQVRDSDGVLLISNGKSVSIEKDGCLTGLSHGQIGIALALANYVRRCEPARPEQIDELIDSLTRWELSKYVEHEANWPDYRVRSGAENALPFEFGWSHGAPGIYLALTQLAASNRAARQFVDAVPYGMILETALRRRRSPRNVTICHGALGAANLSRRLLAMQNDAPTVAARMDELIAWSRLSEFVEMDKEEFNLTEFDMPGLWTGRAGAALGYACLERDNLSVPFLIEDTFELLNMECQYVD